MVTCRNWMLNDLARELCFLASQSAEDFGDVMDKFRNEIQCIREKRDLSRGAENNNVDSPTLEGCIRGPNIARPKWRRNNASNDHPLVKGVRRCGICREVGHNTRRNNASNDLQQLLHR
ncbi:hypothetical protein PIB30_038557 [Stylosanthes scabra]|uniref:Uncharacterized protein n=1 Tax=Stylosanthes scabra TaxID=79078 RepID=A0ABU6YCQ6_9FABA|nr:hypothetical protein [Stylosanthes scabra]